MTPKEANLVLQRVVSQDLLDALKVFHPNILPSTIVPPTEVARLIGRQDIITMLRLALERSER
jgi:hypothetical protein